MTNDQGQGSLVSVLIPTCGMLEFTRLSLPRVLKHSRSPIEVICIDAGSLDGTEDYLAGVADAASVPVSVLRGEREGDFAVLVEEAMKKARGTFIAWLNNDVLVPEMWLTQLLALVSSNDVIGAVGPMSNIAPKMQQVANVPYRLGNVRRGEKRMDTQAIDRFAREFRETNKAQWAELEHLAGFCWLARRVGLDRVSVLGNEKVFDASKLSTQIRQAGFRLACCRDLFVHHFGSYLLPNAGEVPGSDLE